MSNIKISNNERLKFLYVAIGLTSVLFLIPWIISWAFGIEAPAAFFAVKWNAATALEYFGSALGGIGTIFLGIITILQTKQIKALETDRENANVKRPFFIIDSIFNSKNEEQRNWGHDQNGYGYMYDKNKYAFIKIINVGEGVANNLIFEPWGFGELSKGIRPSFCIPSGGFCTIPIHLLVGSQTDSVEKIEIIYENLIGYAYSQEIELSIRFSPKIVGSFTKANGETVNEEREEYKAQIFNIHPQVAHGMGKYDDRTGKYIID